MKFRIASKLKYLKKARHRHGHGIHSPFLFRLITCVIEDKKKLPAYKIMRDQRERLSKFIKENSDQPEIQILKDSILHSSGRKKLLKAVELPLRYGKLVLRLVNEFKPESILYCGHTFGLNLLYLGLSEKEVTVDFYQPKHSLSKIAQETLKDLNIRNVNYCKNEFPKHNIPEFIFINIPYSPEETEKSVNAILDSESNKKVLIIRGIHESMEMHAIWTNLIKNFRIRVSLDLFEIGLAMFRQDLQKEHFVLRFKNK